MKLSPTRDAVRKRIRALPRKVEEMALMVRQRDADAMILAWRSGMVNRTFRLTPLKPATVDAKRRKGYAMPSVPLYGLGMEGPWTYIKALRKYRVTGGWEVRVPASRHHSSSLTLDKLLEVHEYGAVIRSKGGRTFRIPPRPLFTKAYEYVTRNIKDDSEQVLKAAWELIEDGKSQTLLKIRANAHKMEAMIGAGR